jgi:glutamate 5-kinase|tara:strand:+ start:4004 stop:5143 length:1140 start_codon:yes stop_codon:yes gene_type:complete
LVKNNLDLYRVVVKIGTNVLTQGGNEVIFEKMQDIVRQISILQQEGHEVLLVTSGAITEGLSLLTRFKKNQFSNESGSVASKQVLAAVGQVPLMRGWEQAFTELDILSAQALITRRDVSDRLSYLHARNTLLKLLELDIVPIINENDVVAIDEIAEVNIGDNDHLSALISNLVDADLLVILSDVDGLYESDPRTNKEAALISEVELVDDYVISIAGAAGDRGRGGMATKVSAAKIATESGTDVLITNGNTENCVLSSVSNERSGTFFPAQSSKLESRRRYLLSNVVIKGHLIVDDGAEKALRKGSSILPVGVVGSDGDFHRGDVVDIDSVLGIRIGVGIANYSANELGLIKGIQSSEILSKLGYEYGEEIIHRNNMTLT